MAKNEVNNQKANENNNEVNQEQQNAQNVQQQPETPTVTNQAPVTEEQKGGFKVWLKKHWKGVTAGAVGLVAAGGSAFAAYKKGKAAGIMAAPMPQQEPEDYSLNPNE